MFHPDIPNGGVRGAGIRPEHLRMSVLTSLMGRGKDKPPSESPDTL